MEENRKKPGEECPEEVRERLQKLHGDSVFSQHNFIEYDFLGKDLARFKLRVKEESKNGFGYVHGSAIYLLADNACGHAADSDGRMYVTQSGGLHYLGNQKGGVLTAEARVVHRGRKTCLVRVDVRGEEENLLATGEFTYYCVTK